MTSGENHTLESGSNGLVELMVPSAIGPKSAAYDRQLPFRLVHHFLLYCLHSRPDYASTIDCTDDAENFATLIDEAKFRKLGGNITQRNSGPVHLLIGLLHGASIDNTIDLLGVSTHHDPLTG